MFIHMHKNCTKSSFKIYSKYTKTNERKRRFNDMDTFVFCCIKN